MSRQPVSEEEWKHARAMWEADDKVSFAVVGEALGISKQAVSKRAGKDGWKRSMDASKVSAQAHRAADKRMMDQGLPLANFAVNSGNEAGQVDPTATKNDPLSMVPDPDVDTSQMSPAELADHRAVQQRTAIIARHRTELMGARNRIYESIRAKDPNEAFLRGKVAKITTEALGLLHAAERKAWGIESGPAGGEGAIIIERG